MALCVGVCLENLIETEKEMLTIALGVLRSGTDWADFLGSWLSDYGTRVLRSSPPPLMPDEFDELVTPTLHGGYYIN